MNSNERIHSTNDLTPPCCGASSGVVTDPPISERPVEEVASGTVILKIPGLLERPVIGGGCCAYLAAEAIAHEISVLNGVEDAFAPGDDDNEVVVVSGEFKPFVVKAIRDAVECFDYEIESVAWECRDGEVQAVDILTRQITS